jgi:cathepsin B
MSVIKSFATILKSNRFVRLQASKYKQTKKTYEKPEKIPEEFNPIDKWSTLLQSIKNQGDCGCCWAMATSGCLGDRLTIMTLAQFFVELSPYQMIICEGAIIDGHGKDNDPEYIKEINNQAHSSGSCNGNSLYSAMDFLYSIGITTERCVNEGEFNKYNIKNLEDVKDPDEVPVCQDILGKNYDECLDRKTAARFYRICAGYEVDSDIESIKQEIYKWGPVCSGFNVYEKFKLDYNGITIYTGPKEGEEMLGGHAIKIMGWGSQMVNEEKVDYWWIANSWGTNWGLSGYFKMKMNIKECELEKNVVGFIPDLVGFNINYLLYDIQLDKNDIFLRSFFNIDQRTGLRKEVFQKIKDGVLKGNFDPICKYIPDFKNMWAGKLGPENVITEYVKLAQYHSSNSILSKYLFYAFLCVLSYYVGKLFKKIYKMK